MPRPEIARAQPPMLSQNQAQPDKLKDCFLGLIQDLKQEIHTTFTSQLMEIKGQLVTLSQGQPNVIPQAQVRGYMPQMPMSLPQNNPRAIY